MRVIRVRKVPQHLAGNYLVKAESFLNSALHAQAIGNWNAAALNAIHAAISSVDYANAITGGERSLSQNHEDAAELLLQTRLPDAPLRAKQLKSALRLKTLTEYDTDVPTEKQARELVRTAQNLYEWAKTITKP